MRESKVQSDIIRELKKRFPGCHVLKTDPNYIQGYPDILVLYRDKWAALEVKRSEDAPKRPNQEYYVDQLNGMSFSRFIFPENMREVLDELQRSFEA